MQVYLDHHPEPLHNSRVGILLAENSGKVHPWLIWMVRRGLLEVPPGPVGGVGKPVFYRLTEVGRHIAGQPLIRRFAYVGEDDRTFLLTRPRVQILRIVYAHHPHGLLNYEIGEELGRTSTAQVRALNAVLLLMSEIGLLERDSVLRSSRWFGRLPKENTLTGAGLELAAAVAHPKIPLSTFP